MIQRRKIEVLLRIVKFHLRGGNARWLRGVFESRDSKTEIKAATGVVRIHMDLAEVAKDGVQPENYRSRFAHGQKISAKISHARSG